MTTLTMQHPQADFLHNSFARLIPVTRRQKM